MSEDDGEYIPRVPMFFATHVLKPPPGRIGQLSENWTLPRTISLPGLLGGVAGGITGLLVGAVLWLLPIIGGLTTMLFCVVAGAGGGSILVQWKPWEGESLMRALSVRWVAASRARQAICPGTGLPTRPAPELGVNVCLTCNAACETDDGFALEHRWRRRMFVGIMEIPAPATGLMYWTNGSVPVRRERRNGAQ